MCGIVGICNLDHPESTLSREVLDAMTDAVKHRGPDGRGVYLAPGIGIGHRRLSILDPSSAGRQPMSAQNGQVWITYNGEIYNFLELREELENKGHVFKSRTDTEVVLYAYIEWGLECVDKLNGIFAFGLWDERHRRLWLVRDHLGVKPLFYSIQHGQLSFASEVSALWRNPALSREVDFGGLDAFMTFSYVPAPLTGYKDVRQLLPGEWLLAEAGRIQHRKYWDVSLDAPKFRESEEELEEAFGDLFRRVVKRQMIADVPVGCYLSGGIDSFAVARAMHGVNGDKTQAFSMGFREPSFDEAPLAKIAADTLGVDFHCGYVEPVSQERLRVIVDHAQEPFGDSSMLAVYGLSELTRKHVKVVLSGDGADEILAGYPTYRASRVAPWFRLLPGLVRKRAIPSLVRAMPASERKYAMSQILNRFVYGANQGKWRDHASWRVICTNETKKKIYSPELWARTRDLDPLGSYEKVMRQLDGRGLSNLDAWLYADLTFYLPNDMLVKVDRMSMAHGLEARVPYLDRELVEFCWRLPDRLKMNWLQGKVLLRRKEKAHYPAELARLPKKGFNVPLEPWFRNGVFQLRSKGQGLFTEHLNWNGVTDLGRAHAEGAADYAHVLHSIMILEHL